MFLAGIVFFISDRLAMSRPKGKGVGGAFAEHAAADRPGRRVAMSR